MYVKMGTSIFKFIPYKQLQWYRGSQWSTLNGGVCRSDTNITKAAWQQVWGVSNTFIIEDTSLTATDKISVLHKF